MNYKNYFIKSLLCIGLIFSTLSCTSDDDETEVIEMTPTEAKLFVKENLENFTSCIESYNNGEFANLFYNYLVKDDSERINMPPYIVYPDNGKTDWISDVFNVWESQYGSFFNISEHFNFETKKGIYTWNHTTHKFTKSQKGESLTMIFPSDRGESDLNLKLIVDKYVEQDISTSGTNAYFPSSLHATFYDKENKVMECTADNIKFQVNSNFSMPIFGNMVLYTAPVTHKIALARESPKVFLVSEVFWQERCVTSINGKIELKHEDYSNLSTKDINFIDLKLSHNNLVVKVNVNFIELNKLDKSIENLNDTEFKKVIKSELFKGSKKVGDLVLKNIQEEDTKGILILSDNSEVELTENFNKSLDRLKEILKRFLD